MDTHGSRRDRGASACAIALARAEESKRLRVTAGSDAVAQLYTRYFGVAENLE